MRDAHLVRYPNRIVDNCLILSLGVHVFKWEHPSKHLIHNHAYRPPISCLAVGLTLEDLRGDIRWCAYDSLRGLVVSKDLGEAKVNYH